MRSGAFEQGDPGERAERTTMAIGHIAGRISQNVHQLLACHIGLLPACCRLVVHLAICRKRLQGEPQAWTRGPVLVRLLSPWKKLRSLLIMGTGGTHRTTFSTGDVSETQEVPLVRPHCLQVC